ncbi:hypothetical protein [Phenylobacterium immobile]|uniref:hypothetical protein n=1 Tax=Phenylobacterium immobile TaxID=21 RepID=UPI0011479D77|nr:hypothetical protein [Phenylobacterium immobile]
MRALGIMTLAMTLSACVSNPGSGLDGYAANYDNLKRAQDACIAKGQTLTLREGGDNQNLTDYACKRN